MRKPLFNKGEKIFYYNKWENQIQNGEIINIRPSNLNWDYSVRYQVYSDFFSIQWVEEKYISRDDHTLLVYV